MAAMRLAEFDRLVADEFGEDSASFILSSQVLPDLGGTAEELVARGVELAQIWSALCDAFDVPEERRFGRDE